MVESSPLKKHRLKVALALLALSMAVWVPYAQVASFEFVSFDDSLYVYDNPHLLKGLTTDGLQWAFSFSDRAYWHPLTWLSLMLDYTLFGLNPAAFHLNNVFLHMLNVWLLFLFLWKATGASGKSIFVALLFALHPINVESVAWVAERKNLLAGFFWLFTLMSYHGYCRKSTILRYGQTLTLFCLGLMCKPVLVVLPIIFLLLDEWPFSRSAPNQIVQRLEQLNSRLIQRHPGLRRWVGLILEKLPYFLFALLTVALATLSADYHGISLTTVETPVFLRLSNAVVSCVKYIFKMIFPYPLSVFYPYPEKINLLPTIGAIVFLAIVTFAAWKWRKTMGYCFTGWFWFVVALAPTSGIKQAGLWPEMADRWAYLPFIGLFIALTWALNNRLIPHIQSRWIKSGIILLFCVLGFLSWRQTTVWSNSLTLYGHAVDVDTSSHIAHNNFGGELYRAGQIETAVQHFIQALLTNPDYADAQNNLLTSIERVNGRNKMTPALKRLSSLYPDNPAFYFLMGRLAYESRDAQSTINYYRKSLDIDPGFIQTLNALGRTYVELGEFELALAVLKKRATIAQANFGLYYDMARCYAHVGEKNLALMALRKAAELGFNDWHLLFQDPVMADLSGDPIFRKLIGVPK